MPQIQPPSPPYVGPRRWHGGADNKPIKRIVVHCTAGGEPGQEGSARGTAIYTKGDGIVAWRSCVDDGDPNVEHVEVNSTHLGLGVHHAVFVEVAQRLHRARRRRA